MFEKVVDIFLKTYGKKNFLKASSVFRIIVDITLENTLKEKLPQSRLHVITVSPKLPIFFLTFAA